jgi:alpha-ketoglutarate-dependent taurine dioxygenase
VTHVVTGTGEPLSAISRADKIALLEKHGAVVFTGFRVDEASFRAAAEELGTRFYNMALDPRIREVITPDGVVAGVLKGMSALPLHMERGYSPLKPELVMFHVIQPSPSGGQSLLCHGDRVLEALTRETRDRFRTHRIRYHHTWEPEAWRSRYGATQDEVIRTLGARPDVPEVRFDGDLLHYTYVAFAVARSRLGGSEAFVNNLEGMWELMHGPRETRRAVHEHTMVFENGDPITQELIDEIHAAVTGVTEERALAACDVILIDNYRVMHGRRAFAGARVMHTIMADAGW